MTDEEYKTRTMLLNLTPTKITFQGRRLVFNYYEMTYYDAETMQAVFTVNDLEGKRHDPNSGIGYLKDD